MEQEEPSVEFHHIGIAVERIADSLKYYSALFGAGSISPITHISSQNVNVCFVNIGDGSYIELVEPAGENSPVTSLLRKRVSYYHMGYKVKDFDRALVLFEARGYRLLSCFHSEAFDGKRCIFIYSPEAHLMELIEQ